MDGSSSELVGSRRVPVGIMFPPISLPGHSFGLWRLLRSVGAGRRVARNTRAPPEGPPVALRGKNAMYAWTYSRRPLDKVRLDVSNRFFLPAANANGCLIFFPSPPAKKACATFFAGHMRAPKRNPRPEAQHAFRRLLRKTTIKFRPKCRSSATAQ